MGKLTAKGVDKLAVPGRYGDGGGLWFQVRKPDTERKTKGTEPTRSWLYRYAWQGRQRQLGLGPYPLVGLADARRAAQDAARAVQGGRDPIAERRAAKAAAKVKREAMTFNEVTKLYIAAHESSWRNAKHRQQWENTLENYVTPIFGSRLVQDVDTGAVMKVIAPLWQKKTETASRLLGRIATVIDYAAAMGWRQGENPARWKGHFENLLPKRSKVAAVEHHAALPWAEMGAFMAKVEQQAGTSALALRFTILTAARTGEVIGARWSEIDLKARLWIVPAERMKGGRLHRVPLTDAALDVLLAVLPLRRESGDGYVFPGRKAGTGMSNMSLAAVLKRMERDDLTVHGFRSTFRQWAGEQTTVAREVAEAALAHSLKDRTEAAYARGDLLDRRRRLMELWTEFCATTAAPAGSNAVPVRAAETGE